MCDELVKRLREEAEPCDRSGCVQTAKEMRQAADAIEELQQIAAHYEETAKDYFKDVCYYLERVPKWIPVTERLPEAKIGYYVLVYEDGDIMMASYSNGEWYLRDMYEIIELKPTHWMPLPEPPKKET